MRKSYGNMAGRKFQIGNAYSYIAKKGYSYLYMWMTSNWLERNKNLDPMWKLLNKEVDFGEPTSFLGHVYLGCTQRQCQISKDVDSYRTMFESRISAGRVVISSTCPCSCERFSSPCFLLLHFLPHSFPSLLHMKFVDYLNLLRTPHKEGMDSSDEFLLTTNPVRPL